MRGAAPAGKARKSCYVARAPSERRGQARRRRKHAGLTIQRMWRGVTSRSAFARGDAREVGRAIRQRANESDSGGALRWLLPPLRSVGAASGATRTLRALALALGTSDLCAPETRVNVRDWTVRRVASPSSRSTRWRRGVRAASAGVVDDADRSGDKDEEPAVDNSGFVRPERLMNAREQGGVRASARGALAVALVMTRADGVADGGGGALDGAEEKISHLKKKTPREGPRVQRGIRLDLRGGGVSRQAV